MRARGGILIVLVWAVAVTAGMVVVAAYSNAPGAVGEVPARWPDALTVPLDSGVSLDGEAAMLVMMVHPRCPCTRASMRELERVMSRATGRARAYVLFHLPEGKSPAWVETNLWRKAASVPGVTPVRDWGGLAAKRLGGMTSGHVVLYDAEGRLRFSGGITAGRGHEGPNAGRFALIDLLTGEAPRRSETFVFGCPLKEGDRPCRDDFCLLHS